MRPHRLRAPDRSICEPPFESFWASPRGKLAADRGGERQHVQPQPGSRGGTIQHQLQLLILLYDVPGVRPVRFSPAPRPRASATARIPWRLGDDLRRLVAADGAAGPGTILRPGCRRLDLVHHPVRARPC